MAQAGDALAKVKSSGAITLGVRESSGALGYTLGDGKFVGFHTEMAENIAHDLQKNLGLAKLDIKYQPVTSQNRIPLVTNGTVDLECGSTTNDLNRQKEVDFANTTYVEQVRIAVRKTPASKMWKTSTARPWPPPPAPPRCNCCAKASAAATSTFKTSWAKTMPTASCCWKPAGPMPS